MHFSFLPSSCNCTTVGCEYSKDSDVMTLKVRDCLTWRRLKGDTIATFQYLKGVYKKNGDRHFKKTCSKQ